MTTFKNILSQLLVVISHYWLFGISIIMLCISIFLNFGNIRIDDTSIVLAFVGILATFVVVSNYAQVKEMENRINKIESDNEKMSKNCNINKKSIDEKSTELNELEGNMYQLYSCIAQIYGIFDKKNNNNNDVVLKYIFMSLKYFDRNQNKKEVKNNIDFVLSIIDNCKLDDKQDVENYIEIMNELKTINYFIEDVKIIENKLKSKIQDNSTN